MSAKTILGFEAGDRWSEPLYLDLVRKRLEIEGVEFIADLIGRPGREAEEGRVRARHLSQHRREMIEKEKSERCGR